VAVFLACVSLSGTARAKPFMDYIKPAPIVCSPLSSATWGVAGVRPRDICNGIESARGADVPPEFYYWDGQIIKARDGKYHMFLSTWSGTAGFNPGWQNSDAYHAISSQGVLGPYERQGYVYTNNGSHKGHNVTAVELPDGTYAVVVGEVVPLTIYRSSSLDGPWTACSPSSQVGASNVSLFPRHDGRFQIVERNGTIAIADTLCGTYVKQRPTTSYTQAGTDSIYPMRTSIPGVSNPVFTWQEDPHIWRSGGVYHVIYSGSGDRVGWHVYSTDGITNWRDNGYAWSPREYERIFGYEGSTTKTQWYKMERPGVVLEGGHPTHITWAVSDVDKDNMIPGNSNHGSKVIVIPFDGVAFDNDFGVGGMGGQGGAGGAAGSGAGGGAGGNAGRGGGAGGGSGPGGGAGVATGGASGGGNGGAAGAAGSIAGTSGASGASGNGGTATGGASGASGAGATTGTGGMSAGGGVGGTSSSGGPGTGGGAAGGSGSTGEPGTPPEQAGDSAGCACATSARSGNVAWLPSLGFLAVFLLRRRRRPSSARR
jgi:MYXO-CTERM domain-containing protein